MPVEIVAVYGVELPEQFFALSNLVLSGALTPKVSLRKPNQATKQIRQAILDIGFQKQWTIDVNKAAELTYYVGRCH